MQAGKIVDNEVQSDVSSIDLSAEVDYEIMPYGQYDSGTKSKRAISKPKIVIYR